MLIRLTRRQLFLAAPALAQLQQTPMQTIGPFYPADRPTDQDADLTVIRGKAGRAKGQLLYVTGRVMDDKGEPVRGARLEIWQCNAAGKYRHPGDTSDTPLDPNFEGFGVVTTDKDGRYRFKTIKPGAYAVSKTAWRTPHIHFDITGKQTRIITQLYFPNEPLNEKDSLFKGTKRVEALVAKVAGPEKGMEPEAKIAVWDVVLNRG